MLTQRERVRYRDGDPMMSPTGLGVTVIGVLVALCCIGFAVVNIFFETTDYFAGGPYDQYGSAFTVMNWLVAALKVVGATVALLSVAQRPRFVTPSVVAVLVWGAFATIALYAIGGIVEAVGMTLGLSGTADQIDIAEVGYLSFFLLLAAGFGVLATSYSRRQHMLKRFAVLGTLGAPVVLGLILLAVPALLAAFGLLPPS
jgi:hypothetical protein